MPKAIFSQHQFLDNLLDKQGFYKSPAEKDAAIHFASLSRFQELYGDDAEYAPDKPLPRRAYQLTQGITDKLQPFLREFVAFPQGQTPATVPTNFPAVLTQTRSNEFVLPKGWVHPTAMQYVRGGSLSGGDDVDVSDFLFPLGDVKMVDDDKWGRRMRSKTVAPDATHPIARALKNGYRLAPSGILYGTYLSRPETPVYAGVVNPTTGNFDYDDAKSVDTGWPEIEHNDLLMKAAEILGVSLQDGQLVSFARYKAQTGG